MSGSTMILALLLWMPPMGAAAAPEPFVYSLDNQNNNIARLSAIPGKPRGRRIEIGHRVPGENWQIQLALRSFRVEAKKQYTVRFMARADKPRTLSFGAGQDHNPYNNIGLYQTVSLTTEWQPISTTFTANLSDPNVKLHFDINEHEAAVELDQITFDAPANPLPPPPAPTPPKPPAPSRPGAAPSPAGPVVEREQWMLSTSLGAMAQLIALDDKDALRVAIGRAPADLKRIQLVRWTTALQKGAKYKFSMRIRADGPRTIVLALVGVQNPPDLLGLHEKIELKPDWQTIEREFEATADAPSGTLRIVLGGSDVDVEVSQISLTHDGKSILAVF